MRNFFQLRDNATSHYSDICYSNAGRPYEKFSVIIPLPGYPGTIRPSPFLNQNFYNGSFILSESCNSIVFNLQLTIYDKLDIINEKGLY